MTEWSDEGGIECFNALDKEGTEALASGGRARGVRQSHDLHLL